VYDNNNFLATSLLSGKNTQSNKSSRVSTCDDKNHNNLSNNNNNNNSIVSSEHKEKKKGLSKKVEELEYLVKTLLNEKEAVKEEETEEKKKEKPATDPDPEMEMAMNYNEECRSFTEWCLFVLFCIIFFYPFYI
jgi:hypothetical protein